jgi:protein-S-isoprenylcysteine O-methyltransferase Ste14
MTLRQRHFIDSHKCATAFVVLAMIGIHGAWDNPTAWVYLGLHGTYGFLWAWKSRVFGDSQWEKPCHPLYGIGIWGLLSLYWIAPWVITSRDVRVVPWFLGICVAMWGIGVFLHFAADMHKHVHLQLRPGTLFTGGLWARVRNPNYLGELLIYLGFSLLALHWVPLAALATAIATIWIPNMIRKDRSLSRYPEFADYKARSKLLIPFVI